MLVPLSQVSNGANITALCARLVDGDDGQMTDDAATARSSVTNLAIESSKQSVAV